MCRYYLDKHIFFRYQSLIALLESAILLKYGIFFCSVYQNCLTNALPTSHQPRSKNNLLQSYDQKRFCRFLILALLMYTRNSSVHSSSLVLHSTTLVSIIIRLRFTEELSIHS